MLCRRQPICKTEKHSVLKTKWHFKKASVFSKQSEYRYSHSSELFSLKFDHAVLYIVVNIQMEIKIVICPNFADCCSCFLKFRPSLTIVIWGGPGSSEWMHCHVSYGDFVFLKLLNEINYFWNHMLIILSFQEDLSPVPRQISYQNFKQFIFGREATPMPYRSSPIRGRIGASAACLHQRHVASLTRWARPGMEPLTSWILIWFVSHWATMGTPLKQCFGRTVH